MNPFLSILIHFRLLGGTSIIKDSFNLWKKYGKYYDLFLDILHELHEICSVIKSAWSVIEKRNGLCIPCPAPDTHAHHARNGTQPEWKVGVYNDQCHLPSLMPNYVSIY